MSQDTLTLFTAITDFLDYEHRDWSDFLINDCREFVARLHSFRLEHLIANQEQFVQHIEDLQKEYLTMLEDDVLSPQAETTIQALFLLSCVEFASANKERMIINSYTPSLSSSKRHA